MLAQDALLLTCWAPQPKHTPPLSASDTQNVTLRKFGNAGPFISADMPAVCHDERGHPRQGITGFDWHDCGQTIITLKKHAGMGSW